MGDSDSKTNLRRRRNVKLSSNQATVIDLIKNQKIVKSNEIKYKFYEYSESLQNAKDSNDIRKIKHSIAVDLSRTIKILIDKELIKVCAKEKSKVGSNLLPIRIYEYIGDDNGSK
jgi:hypothetical protein